MKTTASTQLPKAYEPATIERQALGAWNNEKLFHAEPGDPGKPYSIVIPPPNVTAALHLGHALNNTLQDILVRWHRMLGDNTVWLPGTDHAGIATQTVVEKRVLKEEGKKRTDFQRDEFVARIQAWKDEYEQRITEQLKAMGCSCDFDRQAFTMDQPRARAVREAFFQLFKAGLIYRGKRLVNWDPATQTALADDEVENEEIDGHFYYLRYPLIEDEARRHEGTKARSENEPSASVPLCLRASVPSGNYVTVATTRPETMLGDTAVAINPKDPRAAALRGRKVRLPIVDRIIPIIEDDYVVLPDPNSDDAKAKYATGFLKVTPAHDPNDYDIGQRHGLPMINVLAPDGSISDKHGWTDIGGADFVLGLDRYEARRAIVEWFRQNELLEDVKPYRHSVGHSYRSHVPIEPYLSDQWYLKVTDDRLAGAALRAMSPDQRSSPSPGTPGEGGAEGSAPQSHSRSEEDRPHPSPPQEYRRRGSEWQGQLRFYPARYAKTFQTWHENLRDWCISRQLWWGHRIPVWSVQNLGGSAEAVVEFKEKLRKWTESSRIAVRGRERFGSGHTDPHEEYSTWFICVRDPDDEEVVSEIEHWRFSQDPDVLDTWFSSGLWPMSTLGWPDETPALEKWNPTSVLCTAREIITLWVSRMVMFNLFFRDALPFYDVSIHPMVQDGEGRKMSKSLGNGVDPLDIIHSHGADAMRFTLAHMTTQTQDVRMPVEKDPATGRNTSPKFDLGRNFCNKLWNAVRFALSNLENIPAEPIDESRWSIADRWIVSRAVRTIQAVNEALREYRYDAYAKSIYDFFWRDLCDWYIEAIKPRMRDPQRAPQTSGVLALMIDVSLRLMHPVIPFITEVLWWKLNEVRPQRGIPGRLPGGEDPRLIRARFPVFDETMDTLTSSGAEFVMDKLQGLITAIRTVRNDHKVEPKRAVTVSIQTPENSGHQIQANREMIELLATCTLAEIGPQVQPARSAAKASACGCEIYVQGVVDEAAEQQRLGKRREELTKLIATLKGRLANAGYLAKAPPQLVQQTKDQLAAAEAELAKIESEQDG